MEKKDEKTTESQYKNDLSKLEEDLIKMGAKKVPYPKGQIRVRIFPEPKK